MKILFYDCFAGVSGDMHLAALLSLGVDADYLRAGLSGLGLDHEFELRVTPDTRKGIAGLRVDVTPAHGGRDDGHGPRAPHSHDHDAAHRHWPRRNLPDIEAIITGSALPEPVQRTSCAIFRKLAEAEARVHGKPVHEVHFHEVGAIDSIVDIVGAAICFHRLGVDAAWASPVELGGGFVHCAHGLMPVPAPATVELLAGIPTTRGATPHEATTPTGAAILATLARRFTTTPRMAVQRTGYGIGHRDTELPNLLRVHLAEPMASGNPEEPDAPANGSGKGGATPDGLGRKPARLLYCNIDDMTAEQLAVALELLMAEGAMDVHFTPIIMKKGRPATCVSLLCARNEQERFARLLFRHTTTLGIKSVPVDKIVLETRFERLETPLGPVTMKQALLDGTVLRAKPELEDCKALASRHGIPLADVYLAVGKVR